MARRRHEPARTGIMHRCASPTSNWNATSPAGNSRSSTSCVPATSRAGRCPSCSTTPTRRRRRSGATCTSATRRRPATRSCVARSPSLYETATPDDVQVLSGAEEGIFALVNVLLEPGDHAIVTWPGYQSLYEIARACGADVTLHELREDAGWAIDVEAMRGQVTPRTKLIVINAPHNPTGMLPDRASFEAVVAIAAEAGAHLLVDEVYRYLEFEDDARLPAGVDAGSHVVSLGVMSKSFAMAGLRIGWLASRDHDLLAQGLRRSRTTRRSAPRRRPRSCR